MTISHFSLSANIPSVEEFGQSYPQYKPFAIGEGSPLFQLLMTPSSLNSAVEATKIGHSAVTGVANLSVEEIKSWGREPAKFDKQFIGGVICSLMQANGYEKTGTKRAIPHEAFSKGEFYVAAAG